MLNPNLNPFARTADGIEGASVPCDLRPGDEVGA